MGGRAGLALAYTSMFIAQEQHRTVRSEPPARITVSVVTIGELSLGVLTATGQHRAQRLGTLRRAEALEPLPITQRVAATWAALRLALRDAGRRMPLNDSWIAATAISEGIPVVTEDGDYADVPGLAVIRM